MFAHAEYAFRTDDESLKLNLIREIINEGLKVKYYIVRHNLTDEEAFLIESTLIDLLTYPHFNTGNILTNIAAGHHQWDEGIKTVEEIGILYDCSPIRIHDRDRVLLVSLNKSFDQAKADGVYRRLDLYDATRRYWAISQIKSQSVKYVLGVYRGIVRSVLKVDSCSWTDVSDDGTKFRKPRCCFEGELLQGSEYLNKDVSDYPFGSGGAIRYIP